MALCCFQEQAYLIARGVRPLALLGHCVADSLEMLNTATEIERYAVPGSIPFVIERGNGVADYGYAAARWAIELYQWAVCAPEDTVPLVQRHRILGLLLGYSLDAIRRYEEEYPSRFFQSPTVLAELLEPTSSSLHDGTQNKAETFLPC